MQTCTLPTKRNQAGSQTLTSALPLTCSRQRGLVAYLRTCTLRFFFFFKSEMSVR